MSDASALNVSGDLLEAGPSYSYSFSLSSPSICSSSSQLTISPAVSKFLEAPGFKRSSSSDASAYTSRASVGIHTPQGIRSRRPLDPTIIHILAIRTWVNPI